MNVCGLKTRTVYPEFLQFLSLYDFIGLQETKTDSFDDIKIPGYSIHFKLRKNIAKIKSGRIALAYKKKYEQYIKVLDSDSRLIQWFLISKRLTKCYEILCGVVYIPPENSNYSHIDLYFEINEKLNQFASQHDHILLLGDFNSRTKLSNDYIKLDATVFHENGLDEVFEEFQEELDFFFGRESCCLRLNRNNSDTSVNNYGYNLIDFCKLNTLFILNGRTEGDISPGAFTCKNTSCIDYFICSHNVLPVVKCLNVHN